jgi:ParB family chromosome partitioning protein
VVRQAGPGVFTIIAGERRLAAARLLELTEVPCLVKNCTEQEALMIALTENIQRRDLTPIEKAKGLRRLQTDCHLSQEEIGKRIGMSQSAIAHYLRLLDLPREVQTLIDGGELSMGHGKVLAGVAREAQVTELALDCVSQNRSVRDLEMLLANRQQPGRRGWDSESPTKRKEEIELPNGVFVIIRCSRDPESGTIEVPYYSQHEREWTIKALSEARSSSVSLSRSAAGSAGGVGTGERLRLVPGHSDRRLNQDGGGVPLQRDGT